MKVTIAAVGKLKRSPLLDLFRDYTERLRWPVSVSEIDPSRASTAELRRSEESARLGRLLPEKGVLIALDEHGRDLGSEALARLIEQWQLNGRSSLAFVIGGPDGLDPVLTGRAELRLAFGRATWPHLMVRVMLAEQLYRVASLLSGHPYHRGDAS